MSRKHILCGAVGLTAALCLAAYLCFAPSEERCRPVGLPDAKAISQKEANLPLETTQEPHTMKKSSNRESIDTSEPTSEIDCRLSLRLHASRKAGIFPLLLRVHNAGTESVRFKLNTLKRMEHLSLVIQKENDPNWKILLQPDITFADGDSPELIPGSSREFVFDLSPLLLPKLASGKKYYLQVSAECRVYDKGDKSCLLVSKPITVSLSKGLTKIPDYSPLYKYNGRPAISQ